MRLREVYLSDHEQLGVTATRIWNLDLNDPIAYLKLSFAAKAARAGGDCRIYLPKCVSKIEVVDGSDVLYSVSLPEALAVHAYGQNTMPYQVAAGCTISTSRCMVELRFGRDNSDQEFMLDPKKLVNPQLKVTYNFPVDATNWTDAEQYISVSAMVAEGLATEPRGFFMTKNIYEWLTAASGVETIDLPRDYKYRLMLIRIFYPTYSVYTYFKRYKMSCDIDKFVNFNVKAFDLAKQNQEYYSPMFMQGGAIGDGAHVCHLPHHFAWPKGATLDQLPPTADIHISGMVGLYLDLHAPAAAAVPADERGWCAVWGDELWCAEPYRFGNLIDPEEWFDPTSYMSVRLMVEQQEEANHLGGIVLQQMRPY